MWPFGDDDDDDATSGIYGIPKKLDELMGPSKKIAEMGEPIRKLAELASSPFTRRRTRPPRLDIQEQATAPKRQERRVLPPPPEFEAGPSGPWDAVFSAAWQAAKTWAEAHAPMIGLAGFLVSVLGVVLVILKC